MVALSNMENPFKPAQKEQAKLRMLLMGPSGSGKTYSALQVATRLAELENGKIALIDTEGRSATKYAGEFKFDVLDLSGNYDPSLYIQGIEAAERFGYAVLVIDSFTHAWKGAGGVLEIVDKAGKKMGGNDWAGWSQGRPAQNAMIDRLINAQVHVIGTVRSKTEWALEMNDKGKMEPRKIGMAADQSADFEYEFDVAVQMDTQHQLTISKTRCSTLDGGVHNDTKFLAETLHAWLTDGVAPTFPEAVLKQRAETFYRMVVKEHQLDQAAVLEALNVKRLMEYDWSQDTLIPLTAVEQYVERLKAPAPEPTSN